MGDYCFKWTIARRLKRKEHADRGIGRVSIQAAWETIEIMGQAGRLEINGQVGKLYIQ